MAIELTALAIQKVKKLLASEGRDVSNTFLRVKVSGGGCSGLSYGLEFVTVKDQYDMVFEIEGIVVVVDKKSYLYLNGTTIDYVTQGLTGGFTFQNPNAKSSCGCGTSFSPPDRTPKEE